MVPEVSIGLPVYNGENYLRQALDSLVGQSFEDFELVICDNGSTDATEAICRDYASRDRRIRYHRNDVNIGAAGNFNRVFQLTGGALFKWAAHDDVCAPTYLARCVEAMRERPEVSLVQSQVALIDEDGQEAGRWQCTPGSDDPQAHRRLKAIFSDTMCFEVFGLMRRSAMGPMPVMGHFPHGDGVLLARLALAGPFYEVDEPLFCSRRHTEQSGSACKNSQEWAVWFDPACEGRLVLPYWKIYREYLRAIRQARLPLRQRALCLAHWAREMFSDRGRLRSEAVAAGRHWVARRRASDPSPPHARRTAARPEHCSAGAPNCTRD